LAFLHRVDMEGALVDFCWGWDAGGNQARPTVEKRDGIAVLTTRSDLLPDALIRWRSAAQASRCPGHGQRPDRARARRARRGPAGNGGCDGEAGRSFSDRAADRQRGRCGRRHGRDVPGLGGGPTPGPNRAVGPRWACRGHTRDIRAPGHHPVPASLGTAACGRVCGSFRKQRAHRCHGRKISVLKLRRPEPTDPVDRAKHIAAPL
jgi:hypothetical protein